MSARVKNRSDRKVYRIDITKIDNAVRLSNDVEAMEGDLVMKRLHLEAMLNAMSNEEYAAYREKLFGRFVSVD